MDLYNGREVILSQYLVDREEYGVVRTWTERLFSWPWRPWKRTRKDSREIPSRQIIQLLDGSFIMHPNMWAELKKNISQP